MFLFLAWIPSNPHSYSISSAFHPFNYRNYSWPCSLFLKNTSCSSFLPRDPSRAAIKPFPSSSVFALPSSSSLVPVSMSSTQTDTTFKPSNSPSPSIFGSSSLSLHPDGLLRFVNSFHNYDDSLYLPWFIGPCHVGNISSSFALELVSACDATSPEFLVEFDSCDISNTSSYTPRRGSVRLSTEIERMETVQERSDKVEQVLRRLKDKGLVQGWRDERQPVVSSFYDTPLLEIERAAVPYMGVVAFGVHVNGYVRKGPGRPQRDLYVWIGKRASNKATYPGRLDQVVAGGQPVGLSLNENVAKECAEEADIPDHLLDRITPTSVISYRYGTRKGLSTKILFAHDIELPHDFVPVNTDGEVEHFNLVNARQALVDLSRDYTPWKPNSALVFIDFCKRHGVFTMEDPHYLEISAKLHTIYEDREDAPVPAKAQ